MLSGQMDTRSKSSRQKGQQTSWTMRYARIPLEDNLPRHRRIIELERPIEYP